MDFATSSVISASKAEQGWEADGGKTNKNVDGKIFSIKTDFLKAENKRKQKSQKTKENIRKQNQKKEIKRKQKETKEHKRTQKKQKQTQEKNRNKLANMVI